MRRLLWFGAGAGSAVYATRKLRRTAERLTPLGLTDQLAALRAGGQAFADEVRAGMAVREAELREPLGVPAVADRLVLTEISSQRTYRESA